MPSSGSISMKNVTLRKPRRGQQYQQQPNNDDNNNNDDNDDNDDNDNKNLDDLIHTVNQAIAKAQQKLTSAQKQADVEAEKHFLALLSAFEKRFNSRGASRDPPKDVAVGFPAWARQKLGSDKVDFCLEACLNLGLARQRLKSKPLTATHDAIISQLRSTCQQTVVSRNHLYLYFGPAIVHSLRSLRDLRSAVKLLTGTTATSCDEGTVEEDTLDGDRDGDDAFRAVYARAVHSRCQRLGTTRFSGVAFMGNEKPFQPKDVSSVVKAIRDAGPEHSSGQEDETEDSIEVEVARGHHGHQDDQQQSYDPDNLAPIRVTHDVDIHHPEISMSPRFQASPVPLDESVKRSWSPLPVIDEETSSPAGSNPGSIRLISTPRDSPDPDADPDFQIAPIPPAIPLAIPPCSKSPAITTTSTTTTTTTRQGDGQSRPRRPPPPSPLEPSSLVSASVILQGLRDQKWVSDLAIEHLLQQFETSDFGVVDIATFGGITRPGRSWARHPPRPSLSRLTSKKRLAMPLNLDSNHWAVYLWDRHRVTLEWRDSLGGEPRYEDEALAFLEWLYQGTQVKMPKTCTKKDVRQQPNTFDCGIHCISHALVFGLNLDPSFLDFDSVQRRRLMMALSLTSFKYVPSGLGSFFRPDHHPLDKRHHMARLYQPFYDPLSTTSPSSERFVDDLDAFYSDVKPIRDLEKAMVRAKAEVKGTGLLLAEWHDRYARLMTRLTDETETRARLEMASRKRLRAAEAFLQASEDIDQLEREEGPCRKRRKRHAGRRGYGGGGGEAEEDDDGDDEEEEEQRMEMRGAAIACNQTLRYWLTKARKTGGPNNNNNNTEPQRQYMTIDDTGDNDNDSALNHYSPSINKYDILDWLLAWGQLGAAARWHRAAKAHRRALKEGLSSFKSGSDTGL